MLHDRGLEAEPTITDLFREPIILRMMETDGVDQNFLLELLEKKASHHNGTVFAFPPAKQKA